MKNLTVSRHGVYYFQLWIPKHLLNNTFNQKVFRISLNTVIKKEAVKLSYKLMTVLYDLEDRFRNSPELYGLALMDMKDTKNKVWANDIAKGIHEDWERETTEEKKMLEAGLDLIYKIDVLGLDANRILATDEAMICHDFTREYLKNNPEALTERFQIPQIQSTAQTFQSLTIEDLHTALDKRDEVPDHENEQLEVIYNVWKDTVKTDSKTSETIGDIWLFIRFIGEQRRIREITLSDINDYKKFRIFIPLHTKTSKLSIAKIKKLECIGVEKRCKARTLKEIFKRVADFFEWCRTGGSGIQYIVDSSYEQSLINTDYIHIYDVPSSNKREPFSDDDLKLLFHSKLFIKDGHKFGSYSQITGEFSTSAFYWVQLLALFTGARQGELCQLEKKHVLKDKDIWILDLKDNLKTAGSSRKIPIHEMILNLGFREYINSLKGERLFPDEDRKINKDTGLSEGFSKFSARWSTYRDGLGIVPSKKQHEKVFHCFRHTVETRLTELSRKGKPSEKFDSGLIDAIVGHTSEKRSTGEKVYNHADLIEAKANALNRLQYDFIDFNKIVKWDSCSFARKGFMKRKLLK